MGKDRWPTWAGVAGVLLLIVLGVASFFAPAPPYPSNVTQANFDKLREGMTVAEVETILGPPGNYARRPCLQVYSKDYDYEWYGDEGIIRIAVSNLRDPDWTGVPDSPDGLHRLNRKVFCPFTPETYGERWRRQLGL